MRTDDAVSKIQLPEKFGAELPDALHVKTPFASFDKTYSLEGGTLVCKRTVVVLQSKLPANEWKDYKKFYDDASLGQENWIQLTSTNAGSGAGPHPPKPSEGNNPIAAQLISQAGQSVKSSDWKTAQQKLDEAKALQPAQPFLWSCYGWLAMREKKFDEAKKDFRHELELHPDESGVAMAYASYLHNLKGDEEARTVLSASFKNDPSQEQTAIFLASLQAESNLTDAIATLRRAVTMSPTAIIFRCHSPPISFAIMKTVKRLRS